MGVIPPCILNALSFPITGVVAMHLDYVPLLTVQRDLCALPRDRARFQQYLRTIFQDDDLGMRVPLLAMNPMSQEHVLRLLDNLIELDCDGVAAQAVQQASGPMRDVPGEYKITLVVADDLKGGWTNRFANEFEYRFGPLSGTAAIRPPGKLPRWSKHFWLFGVLWTSEPASQVAAREAILASIHRAAYIHRYGPAQSLGAMMTQEGHVMTQAGCHGPTLTDDDLEYSREVLEPFLSTTDRRISLECLFGDGPGRTLGFTPRGLSPWAGLAVALADAQRDLSKTDGLKLEISSKLEG